MPQDSCHKNWVHTLKVQLVNIRLIVTHHDLGVIVHGFGVMGHTFCAMCKVVMCNNLMSLTLLGHGSWPEVAGPLSGQTLPWVDSPGVPMLRYRILY